MPMPMKLVFKIFLICFVLSIITCKKNDSKTAVSQIYCDGLITDTAGTNGHYSVYVPNAFSPNGDGLNDLFKPVTYHISYWDLRIFDENYNLIFQSDSLHPFWDPNKNTIIYKKYYYRIQTRANDGHKIGVCGEVYAMSCLPKGISRSNLTFEDQFDPFIGIVNPTLDTIPNCP